jgi:hypothetical protein
VRSGWAGTPVDARLPLTGPLEKRHW